MTSTEAAAVWGVTRRTVCHWCLCGRIPGAVKGARDRWTIPDDAVKPVIVYGVTANTPDYLPAEPFLTWLRSQASSKAALARRLGVDESRIRRLFKQDLVTGGLVDRYLVAFDRHIRELYPEY